MTEGKIDGFCIFCYLDILGYKDFVLKNFDNKNAAELLFNFLDELVYKIPSSIYGYEEGDELQKSALETVKTIKVSLISDSILIRMPLVSDEIDKLSYIGLFTDFVSVLVLLFFSNIGLFLRGGISIGQHFEYEKNNSFFVFSKVLIQSFLLEKEAKTIRILIGQELIDYFKANHPTNSVNKFIKSEYYLDTDQRLCLDYYKMLHTFSESFTNLYFRMVRKAVDINIKKYKNNEHVLIKYRAFVRYHNNCIVDKFPEFRIEI